MAVAINNLNMPFLGDCNHLEAKVSEWPWDDCFLLLDIDSSLQALVQPTARKITKNNSCSFKWGSRFPNCLVISKACKEYAMH